MKFFTGCRKLSSVMSGNVKLENDFKRRFGKRLSVVYQYYEYRKERVRVADLSPVVPALTLVGHE